MTSPYHIEIETGVTTHEDVLSGINSNFNDIFDKTKVQSISSSSGGLSLDASLGGNSTTTLTEDITGFSITNAATGDSGLIVLEQDNTASWTFSSSYSVLAGDLADIASVTASGSGQASIGWYNDGSDYYLFVSDAT